MVTAGTCIDAIAQQIPGGELSGIMQLRTWKAPTCAVLPSYLARTECMLTWGIIFFSTASWNRGGGGRSTARKRKGDTEVFNSGG